MYAPNINLPASLKKELPCYWINQKGVQFRGGHSFWSCLKWSCQTFHQNWCLLVPNWNLMYLKQLLIISDGFRLICRSQPILGGLYIKMSWSKLGACYWSITIFRLLNWWKLLRRHLTWLHILYITRQEYYLVNFVSLSFFFSLCVYFFFSCLWCIMLDFFLLFNFKFYFFYDFVQCEFW